MKDDMNFKKPKLKSKKKIILIVGLAIVGFLAVDFIVFTNTGDSLLTEPQNEEIVKDKSEDNVILEQGNDGAIEIETKEEISIKDENIAKDNINVKINEQLINVDGKVKFSIESNLPDGSELMISLYGQSNGYKGQTKVILENGKAESELFSNKGEPMPKGKYELNISMSLLRLQSPSVRNEIGEHGEYLEGDLVRIEEYPSGAVEHLVDMEKVIEIK